MKVYIFQYEGKYRVSLRKPTEAKIAGEVRRVDVPNSAGYLLLATQATTDALQDSLRNAYEREDDNFLRWEDDGGG